MRETARVTSRAVPLLEDDVDTDQIVPARFLSHPERIDLGPALFANRRTQGENGQGKTNGDGGEPFVVDRPVFEDAEILLAGANFGCGSSREHAVWALVDAGFRVVVAGSFADIFRANALRNGLLPVALEEPAYAAIARAVRGRPQAEVTVDLLDQTVRHPDGVEAGFSIQPFHRGLLMHGADVLDYLLSQRASILAYEDQHARGSHETPRQAPLHPPDAPAIPEGER